MIEIDILLLFQDTTEAKIITVELPDLAEFSEQPRSFGGTKGNTFCQDLIKLFQHFLPNTKYPYQNLVHILTKCSPGKPTVTYSIGNELSDLVPSAKKKKKEQKTKPGQAGLGRGKDDQTVSVKVES